MKLKDTLTQKLLKTRSVLVSETITDKLAKKIISELIILQNEDKDKPIYIYVNSPGGAADAGFAIYDMVRFIQPKVKTICLGLCASAAVLIYLGTDKNNRFALPNSRFLLHQPSTMLLGSVSDIEINANEIIKLRNKYNEIVAQETGKSIETVNADTDRDFWLNAEEALNYGLVGKIVSSIADIQ